MGIPDPSLVTDKVLTLVRQQFPTVAVGDSAPPSLVTHNEDAEGADAALVEKLGQPAIAVYEIASSFGDRGWTGVQGSAALTLQFSCFGAAPKQTRRLALAVAARVCDWSGTDWTHALDVAGISIINREIVSSSSPAERAWSGWQSVSRVRLSLQAA